MAVLCNYLFLENRRLLCTPMSNRYAKPLVFLQKIGLCFQNMHYFFHSSSCKLKNTFSMENLAIIGFVLEISTIIS